MGEASEVREREGVVRVSVCCVCECVWCVRVSFCPIKSPGLLLFEVFDYLNLSLSFYFLDLVIIEAIIVLFSLNLLVELK